jgi:hypothetical protein
MKGKEGEQAVPDHKVGINVTGFIERYKVSDLKTQETLRAFPTLCYLLGSVTNKPQGSDSNPDGIKRPVFYLTEGSGMFGLKNPEDAMRWKGIFNHVVGSARHTYYLSQRLADLSDEQKQVFITSGFNADFFRPIDPILLRNFMFISHAARRSVDERKWHGLNDDAHPEGESEELTRRLLIKEAADKKLLDLMEVENHAYLIEDNNRVFSGNIVMNILSYSDWTFGTSPCTLEERFRSLRESKRQPEEILDTLENHANAFEDVLKRVLGQDIFERMTNAEPYKWEKQIREAYCSPSGLRIEEAFPNSTEK